MLTSTTIRSLRPPVNVAALLGETGAAKRVRLRVVVTQDTYLSDDAATAAANSLAGDGFRLTSSQGPFEIVLEPNSRLYGATSTLGAIGVVTESLPLGEGGGR